LEVRRRPAASRPLELLGGAEVSELLKLARKAQRLLGG